MSTEYLITVENQSPNPQEFYFFQEPAHYAGGSTVYTNTISHGKLPAYNSGVTSQLQFSLISQYYAGVQKQLSPPIIGNAQLGIISQAAIDVTHSGKEKNKTDVVIDEDGGIYLNTPEHEDAVQQGSFRIATPTFNPNQTKINIGLSGRNEKGAIIMSNFIIGEPTKNIDVQPIVKFYVKTGSYKQGTVVNFTESSKDSAMCDATNGTEYFTVIYKQDGSWEVHPSCKSDIINSDDICGLKCPTCGADPGCIQNKRHPGKHRCADCGTEF
ncbi:hypothetical protein [Clostridium saccharobutylicum]|uniref:Uncharacterized protein n=1 Tax=Clostridium saccharobutylicum TaxID=169679 RepID=A0A1S8MQE9_CLOSA|nr:hypothetical protein [Clostridium saccharobutylicum]OOM06416.1 hypothetical protein CLOSAC_43360 [Clostridium saccharobutylicum]